MAVRHALSAPIFILNSSISKRETHAHRVLMVCASSSKISINNYTTTTTSPLRIRSASNTKFKVFEDQSTGIVCSRDEKGEITCEGNDEGPRFCQQLPSFSSCLRDKEIIELFQRCTIGFLW